MLELLAIILASLLFGRKDSNKPDPYKAAGIAYGLKSNLSGKDVADLGAALGSMGAFDDEN